MQALLFVLTLAAGLLAWRGRRDDRRERVTRLLTGWLAGAVIVRVLLELHQSGRAHGASLALAATAAAAGLWTWSRLASLALVRPRKRDFFLRAPFALVATLLALSTQPGSAAGVETTFSEGSSTGFVFFLALAAWAFRWRDALTTRQLFATAAGLVAYAGLAVPGWVSRAHEPALVGGSTEHTLLTFVRWTSSLSLAHAIMALPAVLGRYVKDPTLGIRTVRRRVALSHSLVLLVPLGIVVGLWVLTTFLGTGAERALTARHAIEAEAEQLRLALAQSLESPAPAPALAALARTREAAWPGIRAWVVEGGRLQRVAGDPVRDEAVLPAWTARLDSLPRAGVVELGTTRWFGAAARDSVHGRAAVALVPLGEALAGPPSRIAGVRITMSESALPPSAPAAKLDTLAVARDATQDSVVLDRIRGVTRRFGLPDSVIVSEAPEPANRPRVRLTLPDDTIAVIGRETNSPGTGQADVPGARWTDRGWREARFDLQVHVDFRSTLSGLYRNVRENSYNLVPILILGALVLMLLPVAIFNFAMVRQLGRSVTEPVAALRGATRALGEGRLEHRIDVRGADELWETAGAFNRMVEGLEVARERETQRQKLENELEVARRIQARLLPAGPPAVAGLEISGHSESAREVGGDYFDHLVLPDGRVLLVIADVSGKGVPAALLMSAFRASLMSQDAVHQDPAEVAARLNDFLHRSVDPGKFVTAFMGFLDPRDGRFSYANAGHNPPALLRADGRVEWLNTGGLILGILSPSAFDSGQVTVERGDLLVLYTDGVTEGANAAGELFGEERLVETLRRRRDESCGDLAAHVVREVRDFEGAQGPADDITVLIARRARG